MNELLENHNMEVLQTVVQRIVKTADPLRIILFGSSARGDRQSESDLDILIVVKDGVHRRHLAQEIYLSLSGLGVAKDIVVVTESDVREHRDEPSLILFPALREGKELYRATA